LYRKFLFGHGYTQIFWILKNKIIRRKYISAFICENLRPNKFHYRLRPGDLVEVRTANEILRSLDSNGTLDGLPFMPEMVEFCGRGYRVFQRVVQAGIGGLLLSAERIWPPLQVLI